MNVCVVAGAKVPPLFAFTSFFKLFFWPFLNFYFNLLKTWFLNDKVFYTKQQHNCRSTPFQSKIADFSTIARLSTTLLYLLKLSKFNLYSCFNSSSLNSAPSKQSALTLFEQKNSSGLIKWFYAVPYIVTNIAFSFSTIYKVTGCIVLIWVILLLTELNILIIRNPR